MAQREECRLPPGLSGMPGLTASQHERMLRVAQHDDEMPVIRLFGPSWRL